jgi:hypothetical protein
MVMAHHLPLSIEAQDERFLSKAAEHDGHSTIFPQVSGGLIATPGEVQIPHIICVETTESIDSLRGKIDPTLERRASGEEHRLLGHEFL